MRERERERERGREGERERESERLQFLVNDNFKSSEMAWNSCNDI